MWMCTTGCYHAGLVSASGEPNLGFVLTITLFFVLKVEKQTGLLITKKDRQRVG